MKVKEGLGLLKKVFVVNVSIVDEKKSIDSEEDY